MASKRLHITSEMSKNIIYTRYAGKMMGNYDIKRVRHLLDELDKDILISLNLQSHIEDVELAYDVFMKATGERPGTTRSNPFDEE